MRIFSALNTPRYGAIQKLVMDLSVKKQNDTQWVRFLHTKCHMQFVKIKQGSVQYSSHTRLAHLACNTFQMRNVDHISDYGRKFIDCYATISPNCLIIIMLKNVVAKPCILVAIRLMLAQAAATHRV